MRGGGGGNGRKKTLCKRAHDLIRNRLETGGRELGGRAEQEERAFWRLDASTDMGMIKRALRSPRAHYALQQRTFPSTKNRVTAKL